MSDRCSWSSPDLIDSLSEFTGSSGAWLQITTVAVWLGCVGLLAEGLSRRPRVEPEMVRKVVHIGVGNVILIAWGLQIPTGLGVSASLLFSAIALLSYRLPILPVIHSVGRKSLGTFFYALSFAGLIGWFWSIQQPHYAVLGVLVMTWGDGLAALLGKRFGRHRYRIAGMQKSWEGSLTMAGVTYLITLGILLWVYGTLWQLWLIALVVAIAATMLESFSKLGIDNLTVPLGSAAIAYWLCQGL